MASDDVTGRDFGRLEATVGGLSEDVRRYIAMNEERHAEHLRVHAEEKEAHRDSHERLHRRLTDEIGPLKEAKILGKGWLMGAAFIGGALVWGIDKAWDVLVIKAKGHP